MLKNKVAYFNKIIEFVIDKINIFLFLTIFIVLSFFYYYFDLFKHLSFIMKQATFIQDIFSQLLIFFCSVALSFLFNRHHIVKFKYFIKTHLYSYLLKQTDSYNFINRFYSYNRIHQTTQDEVLEILVNNLVKKSVERKCIWIEGESFSGKTSMILHFFRDLIEINNYEELFNALSNRIYYFDLARDDNNIQNIYSKHVNNYYSNCLLIFDNLQKMSYIDFYSTFIPIVKENKDFGIIVLMRTLEDDIGDSLKIKHIFSNLVDDDQHIIMNSLIVNNNLPLKGHYSNDRKMNRIINYHVMSISNSDSKLQNLLFNFGRGEDNEFDETFLIIVLASLFTGSFDYNLLKKLVNGKKQKNLKKLIIRLLKSGVITKSPNSENYYYLNENIADYYFLKLSNNEQYSLSVKRISDKLYEYYNQKNNKQLSFFYGIISENYKEESHQLFNTIAINVNFKELLKKLELLICFRSNIQNEYCKELGILCDRTGRLNKAKKLYLRCDINSNNDIFYRLLQIDHSYIKKKKDFKIEFTSTYLCILDEYWTIHMDMHQGIFQLKKMEELVNKTSKQIEDLISYNLYDACHLMRRIYFDYFRIYYLSGNSEYNSLISVCDDMMPLKYFLKNNLSEFENYYQKFAIGLFLGYCILYDIVFRKKYMQDSVFDNILFPYFSDKNVNSFYDTDDVINFSTEILLNVCNNLYNIADKTYIFVKYHMFSIKLGLDKIKSYNEYEAFVEEYSNFATNEKVIEYKIYAILLRIKINLVKLFDPQNIVDDSFEKNEALEENIKKDFIQIKDRLIEMTYNNKYEIFRVELLESLFQYFIQKLKQIDIKALIETAETNGYKRELVILQYISERNNSLSFNDLRKIFKFYPLVTQ
ncbi:hypothetical protein [Faecalitalea cylindroides]|uniref:Uncharacterized protein n=1 Tax=Faecalitalea cylindroides ATCC 27803 TaxID=649755 RepID=U2R7W3_9FIRM|nr:hypothetical protein [Faecalitalea cylindroides]ERK46792.1 hypothetical protein HMPREF0367_00341 [[Eubacterium] cylindroides ATCC 27803] [Faecalitalea cylindroides ATCC 27803]